MLRVMLLYHNDLFAHSIRSALRSHADVSIVGEIDDWTRSERDIERLAPDVVIAEEDERQPMESMLRTLQRRQGPWRVVAMRLDQTAMHIWSGAWQPITAAQDLLDALTPPHPPRRKARRRRPTAQRSARSKVVKNGHLPRTA